jgi:CubicO group peptidase (beta-lactamase class C family)
MPFRLLAVLLTAALTAPAQSTLQQNVDRAVSWALQETGSPGASVALVLNAQLAFAGAFGSARLAPPTPASSTMRYAIGSVSKQFTAAAILLLAEEGKLTLDDPVSRFFPELTRAKEVTIRMLLSHTSGYSDYWPQDYVMAEMMSPTTPAQILHKWAKRPLDFDPGTKWQYSNTNYVIAGQIVEKITGQPLFALLHRRIFDPLGMTTVFNVDEHPLPPTDARGYYRHALGPLRPAGKEGAGWLSAAGELSMTSSDLAKWNISLINRTILKPASYDQMFQEVKLKDGSGTGYGLGVDVARRNGHLVISHSGEVSGFTTQNTVVPDVKAAVIAFVNQDAVQTPSLIAKALRPLLYSSPGEDRVLQLLKQFEDGKIDRAQFTPSCNAYFNSEALSDYSQSLKPLGQPIFLTQEAEGSRGGMIYHRYRVQFQERTLTLTTYEMPDGKLEQFLLGPLE